ncbi:MAG: CBS domain-containing protein [Clostridiales Family XIII bacterium]|jgi:DHA2 family lincomycin resistance protein-like MFS transporter|nr:CBS domain-containing protein [Clostridiales Family XIII bacterium]
MAKITEIMETVPYTCQDTATVRDVINHLTDVQVEGVPIVDAEGRLAGYITDADIIRFISHKKAKIYDLGDMMPVVVDDESLEEKVHGLFNTPVMDIATRKKVYATVDHEIDDVADIFRKEQVRKLAILDKDSKDGKVIGVVTRSMIIRYILSDLMPE